jgi:phospholipase/lecithinase/hemolysin
VPDAGATPAFNSDADARKAYRTKTITWDKFVARHAAVGGIALFALFDNVIANPSAYGLTNVRTADKPRSRTAALSANPPSAGTGSPGGRAR